ncbi:MAG TPA: ABC transporter substrate-binding protein [Bradyrhizobium sp.]|uniref:ABC transporter substrate-binding protein n=1 Tax=Bradyrhizobium sp. TaxID=376 RepID=UPI002BB39B8C|nr:ABC transporter substrate-binding protein [Bradyrhizobium sp.]HTB00532.1 ABC transporter substrate-binding protein [Bradyrhizobium sp.]
MSRGIFAAAVWFVLALPVAANAQTIVIGASVPDTGPAAAPALWQRWGFQIALDEVNAAGGVLGKKVELLAYDNRCNPSEAVNAANKLIEAKVVAILGAHCSSATLATMPLIAAAKVPMVEGIASSPKITELSGVGGNEWTFRINPSDDDMMEALGLYLSQSSKIRRVAVLGEDTDFGRGGAAAFAAVAKKDGLEVISTDFHPQGYPDFTSLLTRIQQSRPDAIALFQLAGDQLNFLRNAMQLGVRIPYIGRFDPGGNNLQIAQAGGMDGSITAWTYSYLVDAPANKAFVAEVEKRHNTTPVLQTWAGYDAMRLLLKAIAEAGSTDPTAIRDAIKKIQFTNVMGAPVKFDDHNQAGKLVLIEGIADRKLTILKEVSLHR